MRSGLPEGGGKPLAMRRIMPVKKAGGELRRSLSRLAYSSSACSTQRPSQSGA